MEKRVREWLAASGSLPTIQARLRADLYAAIQVWKCFLKPEFNLNYVSASGAGIRSHFTPQIQSRKSCCWCSNQVSSLMRFSVIYMVWFQRCLNWLVGQHLTSQRCWLTTSLMARWVLHGFWKGQINHPFLFQRGRVPRVWSTTGSNRGDGRRAWKAILHRNSLKVMFIPHFTNLASSPSYIRPSFSQQGKAWTIAEST